MERALLSAWVVSRLLERFLATLDSLKSYASPVAKKNKKILLSSQSNGNMWHLQDGPEWELRDCALSRDDFKEGASSNTGSDPGNPNPWSNKNFQPWLFGHDVFKEANEALDRMSD
jgi:salicylate hydroxylase